VSYDFTDDDFTDEIRQNSEQAEDEIYARHLFYVAYIKKQWAERFRPETLDRGRS
jgi:hypothetical protein